MADAPLLHLYNSLTKSEQAFQPLDPSGREVSFYTCGPTVYDYAHIGNFRSFLNADLLRRTLEMLGYEVTQVMNMTDVGHMTEDDVADGGGVDKMEAAGQRLAAAKKSGKLPEGVDLDPNDPYAIAGFYADAFLHDGARLGLKVVEDAKSRPALMPRPTQYIEAMVDYIRELEQKGFAYVATDGVVYFDTQAFSAYGNLSGNTLDRIRSGEGGRVNDDTQALKRHPADFMLWKPDAKHLMRWPSPWGEGYPGWHIECSVMAHAVLGDAHGGEIDLHSGGEDNIFPHHECEIAQSCAHNDQEYFARYWFHTRFLRVEGEKMSKSKGNFFTLDDLIREGHSPAAIRLELTRMHYRSQANFTFQGLRDGQRMIDRWFKVHDWMKASLAEGHEDAGPMVPAFETFRAQLCKDLNVSGAIAALNEGCGAYETSASSKVSKADFDALCRMLKTLGVLHLERSAEKEHNLDGSYIDSLIRQRNEARAAKDWGRADEIRDELAAMQVVLKDGPEGTTWSVE